MIGININHKPHSLVYDLTTEQIDWLNACTRAVLHVNRHKIRFWKFNSKTGEVDVDGGFNCSEQELTDFKGIRFGEVGGSFICNNNLLTSLVGAPRKVGGFFDCTHNHLTSLEGAPQEVGEDFLCGNNLLTSLEGAPLKIAGSLNIRNNFITSLEGAPLGRAPLDVLGGFVAIGNPVAWYTLKPIYIRMQDGRSYLKALESLWRGISLEDQTLLYRKEFEWVGPEERRKLEALRAYNDIKNMI